MGISDDRILELLTGIKSDLGEVKGTLTATVEAHEIRFANIEDDVKTNEKQQWIATACVVPVVTALHYLANKMGFKV